MNTINERSVEKKIHVTFSKFQMERIDHWTLSPIKNLNQINKTKFKKNKQNKNPTHKKEDKKPPGAMIFYRIDKFIIDNHFCILMQISIYFLWINMLIKKVA